MCARKACLDVPTGSGCPLFSLLTWYKILIPTSQTVYHSLVVSLCSREQAWVPGTQTALDHGGRTRSLNQIVKHKCCSLITSINLGGISSLESRPPVRGKIKSYVCRKYHTGCPRAKYLLVCLSLSFSLHCVLRTYLESERVNWVSACLKYIIMKWEVGLLAVEIFQITIKIEREEQSASCTVPKWPQ